FHDIAFADTCFREAVGEATSLLDDDERPAIDPFVEREEFQLQQRYRYVDDDVRDDDEACIRQLAAAANQCFLYRCADDQHEDEVEHRHLRQCASARQPEDQQQEYVDDGGANDRVHVKLRQGYTNCARRSGGASSRASTSCML